MNRPRRLALLAAVLAWTLAACAGGAPAKTGLLRFEHWQVTDPMVGGTVAISYLVPTG